MVVKNPCTTLPSTLPPSTSVERGVGRRSGDFCATLGVADASGSDPSIKSPKTDFGPEV